MKTLYDCEGYACYLKDEEQLQRSTSGGAFYVFAEWVIQRGGVVFGAALDDEFSLCHRGVDNFIDLEKLRKSKYIQSRIGNTYAEARTCLRDGRIVLFSGTPCQIAGLRAFLGREYDTLFTVDLICAGVPSDQMFKEYIESLQKLRGRILEFQARDKANGWNSLTISYQYEDWKEMTPYIEDDWHHGIGFKYMLRPCCYNCRFRGMKSGADITIGDYWGIQSAHWEFSNRNGNKGISAVIIKTGRGKELFEVCRPGLVCCESTVKKIATRNPCVNGTLGKRVFRERFFEQYKAGNHNLRDIYKTIEAKRGITGIGIIGSYSSRKCVRELSAYNPEMSVGWQVTNSGICSMTAPAVEKWDLEDVVVSNEYRRESLLADMNKRLENYLRDQTDYLVIDFLEDRYPLLFLDDGQVITESEAYKEIEGQLSVQVDRRLTMCEIPMVDWEKSCRFFISLLCQYYESDQIILNCLYLTENYGYDSPEKKFENIEEIQKINARLKKQYQFFIENCKGIHVIEVSDSDSDYCFEDFAFGCEPVYYNDMMYRKILEQMIPMVEGKEYED